MPKLLFNELIQDSLAVLCHVLKLPVEVWDGGAGSIGGVDCQEIISCQNNNSTAGTPKRLEGLCSIGI